MKFSLNTKIGKRMDEALKRASKEQAVVHKAVRLPVSPPPPLEHWDIPAPNASVKDISNVSLDFNPEATEALLMIMRGVSCSVVGQAGSGKSTIMAYTLHRLIHSGSLPMIWGQPEEHYKALGCTPVHSRLREGMAGVAVVALAHKAVNALATKVSPHIEFRYVDRDGTQQVRIVNARQNLSTVHRLLEFKPHKIEKQESDGSLVETMRFFPSRHSNNPLPDDIKIVIMEEAGQIPLHLFLALYEALPSAQYIALGDLGQIGAVGGMSVLGAFLSKLPSVELTKVYRHGGAIMDLATALRNGTTKGLRLKTVDKIESPESRVVRATYPVVRMATSAAMDLVANFWFQLWKSGNYVAGLDMALCPQAPDSTGESERFGIIGIWRRFAVRVDEALKRNTHYVSTASGPNVIACGDVYYMDSSDLGKRNYMTVRVEHNDRYKGAKYGAANYGTRDPILWKAMADAEYEEDGGSPLDLEIANLQGDVMTMFDAVSEDLDGSFQILKNYEQGRQSTHRVYLLDVDFLETFLLEAGYEGRVRDEYIKYILNRVRDFALAVDYSCTELGASIEEVEFNEMLSDELASLGLNGYMQDNLVIVSAGSDIGSILPAMITIHKGQGTQGRNVFFVTHESVGLNCAESGYTACTRARETLYTVTHADYWGPSPDVPEALATKSSVKRFTIKGATKDEKVASYREAMNREASSEEAQLERIAVTKILDELDYRNRRLQ